VLETKLKKHIKQTIYRTFGWKMNSFKGQIQSVIKNKDKTNFILWIDTFESNLENKGNEKKLKLSTYI